RGRGPGPGGVHRSGPPRHRHPRVRRRSRPCRPSRPRLRLGADRGGPGLLRQALPRSRRHRYRLPHLAAADHPRQRRVRARPPRALADLALSARGEAGPCPGARPRWGPASRSAWARALLDEAAGGTYRGLVITDALDMAAVAESPGYEEAVVRAVEAGAHLLCLGTSIRRDDQQMLREAHDALVEAVASGRLPREILRERAEETRARCR